MPPVTLAPPPPSPVAPPAGDSNGDVPNARPQMVAWQEQARMTQSPMSPAVPLPAGRAQLRAGAGLLFAVMLLLQLLWSSVIPFHGAPDEGEHYEVARFYATHNRLPVFAADGDFYCRPLRCSYATSPPAPYM